MKKFIAGFDGLRYSAHTASYAIQLAKAEGACLVGVFLDDFTRHSYSVYNVMRDAVGDFKYKQELLDAKDEETRAKAVERFSESCREQNVSFIVHHDRSIALQELLRETVFADLLIIDINDNFSFTKDETPSEFIRNLLPDVECPVLLVPHAYKPVDKLILLYDGDPSSVFAIKLYGYCLGKLSVKKVEVFSAIPPGKNQFNKTELMKEFMERHFGHVQYKALKGVPEVVIPNYLGKQRKHVLVVAGAYRRGAVSRWFRESMADVLMRKLEYPLFVAHD